MLNAKKKKKKKYIYQGGGGGEGACIAVMIKESYRCDFRCIEILTWLRGLEERNEVN